MSTSDESLCQLGAAELAGLLRRREVSAVELMSAHLDRIERTNPQVNAIVTLVATQAMAGAVAADEALTRGDQVGPLHGLPVAHKDLIDTAGIRTTQGSPIFADHIPDTDDLIVTRLRAAGAITIGKTNTPEFGAGSHTFNPVFGVTRNPYDLGRSAGGSSGGAAAALACGMVPLADGSDLGGSLRNPASFCNVVGLRPTPGVVPSWPTSDPWEPLSTEGPMGRSVADVALMLAAIAGPDQRTPLARPIVTGRGLLAVPPGLRIGWSPTAGGLPVDARVRSALAGFPGRCGDIGAEVLDIFPDLRDAGEVFQILRAVIFEKSLGELYRSRKQMMKETIRWNVELAQTYSAADVGSAHRRRALLQAEVAGVFEHVDILALPTVQVPPFPADEEWVREIDGVALVTYLDWMRSCTDITITGCPALSLPAGWTDDGLPVGVQLVAAPGRDEFLLDVAAALEAAGEPRRWPGLTATP